MNKALATSIVFIGIASVVAMIYYSQHLNWGNKIVVPEQQFTRDAQLGTEVTINGVTYTFFKIQNSLVISPADESHPTGAIESPQEGETYPWLGINIKILEVHADRYVISVTSRD